MSYKPEVSTAGDPIGIYTSNALRFATEAEAQVYVRDLAMRWTAVRSYRVTACDDPVNYAIIDGVLTPLPEPEAAS